MSLKKQTIKRLKREKEREGKTRDVIKLAQNHGSG